MNSVAEQFDLVIIGVGPGGYAAALYAAFLVDLAARFTPGQDEDWGFDLGWAFTPAEVDFAGVLQRIGCDPPPPAVRFVAQHGDGWDVRQTNILAWGHDQGYERTVLIASDSPQLPFAIVRDAADFLAHAEGYDGVHLDTSMAFTDFFAEGAHGGGFPQALVPRLRDLRERVNRWYGPWLG